MPKSSQETIKLRRKKIIKFIASNQAVTIDMIVEQFNASSVTIRRDINKLIEEKMVIKELSGQIKVNQDPAFDVDIFERYSKHHGEKVAIAQKAIEFVHSGSVIGIDASTTALELAKQLIHRENVTVVTNNLLLPTYLSKHESLDIFSVGGKVLPKWFSTEGVAACSEIQKYNYDIVFFSTSALNFENGLSDDNPSEIDTKMAFLKSAKKRILLMDSSKIGKTALKNFWLLKDIDVVVSDYQIAPEHITEFQNRKIALIIAEE